MTCYVMFFNYNLANFSVGLQSETLILSFCSNRHNVVLCNFVTLVYNFALCTRHIQEQKRQSIGKQQLQSNRFFI